MLGDGSPSHHDSFDAGTGQFFGQEGVQLLRHLFAAVAIQVRNHGAAHVERPEFVLRRRQDVIQDEFRLKMNG